MSKVLPILLLVVVMATSGCQTRRQSKIGMGIGLGVAATGGLVIASEGDDKMGPVLVAAGLASLGGAILLCSLVGYAATK